MKIEVIEIAGFASALKALHLPFGGKEKSQINTEVEWDNFPSAVWVGCKSDARLAPDDLALMTKLVKAGDEHAKVLRGIVVWMKITAPVYVWCEMECYRAGHERLCSESTMHIDCKNLTGEELVKAKSEIPMGKELTKIDFFSYQALRNIYKQRRHHRLPEWHTFCDQIKELPFAEELITCGIE